VFCHLLRIAYNSGLLFYFVRMYRSLHEIHLVQPKSWNSDLSFSNRSVTTFLPIAIVVELNYLHMKILTL
jgi:hypothetical protein